MEKQEVTLSDKVNSLKRVARYRPTFTLFIILFSSFAAIFEAIGLSFLFPILEMAQSSGPVQAEGGIVAMFISVYRFLGIPFTFEYMLLGVVVVMVIRYTSSFLSTWFAAKLLMEYEGYLKDSAFSNALDAKIAYYDIEGSDEILNAIVTQTRFAGKVIRRIVKFFQESLLAMMYFGIALLLAPLLTIFSVVTLGGATYFIRKVVESGYTVGDYVAEANEKIQQSVQSGTQGIRDIKMFGMSEEILTGFRENLSQYVKSNIELKRNEAVIRNLYELTVAVMLFVMVYAAVEILSLSLSALGVFLFAMFRLAPRASTLNSKFYSIEGELPHLVRTHWFIDELERNVEQEMDQKPTPETIQNIAFEDVSFSYDTSDEQILQDISFNVERGEFVAFVGQSGAGKSTLISLLARMYEPDSGEITANATPIRQMDLAAWRDKIGMVRQKPHIFNETLRFNLTIGNRDATGREIERATRIARVDEFLNDLPEGYETKLGDNGVQLSGGQRQRVSLARALLTDAEMLVLDEATSDLDSSLEQEIHQAIDELGDEYIIFVIAHRLSTIKNADRIYTLKSGKIAEVGTHQQLIDKGEKYAELYAIQS